VRILCAAVDRAKADPSFGKGGAAEKVSILGAHMGDGVKNIQVLTFLASAPKHAAAEKVASLKALMAKANVTACPLLDTWQAP
jgi:hypothetical protein